MIRLLLLLCLLLGLAACEAAEEVADPKDEPEAADEEDEEDEEVDAPSGYAITEVVTGLDRPTQMIEGPDGRLWVAQLAGEEDDGAGEVVAIDLDSGEQEVLVEGLRKPTGIAVVGDDLWVVQERSVGRAPLEEETVGEVTEELSDLPYNGRSLGTLTPTRQGTLIFNTTGAQEDGEPVEGSATLWELDPDAPDDPDALATNVQNAYAHTFDAEGHLWATEIVAGTFDDERVPDKLNRIERGTDYGWPRCVADRAPVEEFGGDREICAETGRPAALLSARSTPTGLVVHPWEDDEFVIALWAAGEVVTVSPGEEGGPIANEQSFLDEGLTHPQDLLVTDDGLLISDHATGVVYLLTEEE
jgi:glucose/arabinose dehydrogenase